MLGDQTILFLSPGGVLALLVRGCIRHDLVTVGALAPAVLAGVVPEHGALEGFSDPATVIIALVLVFGKGMSSSGAVALIVRLIVNARHSLMTQCSRHPLDPGGPDACAPAACLDPRWSHYPD